MNCKKAIILAAGTASRLRPLTSNTPKCLLKVGERTLLQRSMDALIKAGISEFVIVTGYLHEQIEDFVRKTYQNSLPLREGRGGSVCFIHNKDYATTNNIYSLWLARTDKSWSASLPTATTTSSPASVTNLGKRR